MYLTFYKFNYGFEILFRFVTGNTETQFAGICCYILLGIAAYVDIFAFNTAHSKTLYDIASTEGLISQKGVLVFWCAILAFLLSFIGLQHNPYLNFDIDSGMLLVNILTQIHSISTIQDHG